MNRITAFFTSLFLVRVISPAAQAEGYARQAATLRALPAATAKVVDRVAANQTLQVAAWFRLGHPYAYR
jgi:hypothetical protein